MTTIFDIRSRRSILPPLYPIDLSNPALRLLRSIQCCLLLRVRSISKTPHPPFHPPLDLRILKHLIPDHNLQRYWQILVPGCPVDPADLLPAHPFTLLRYLSIAPSYSAVSAKASRASLCLSSSLIPPRLSSSRIRTSYWAGLVNGTTRSFRKAPFAAARINVTPPMSILSTALRRFAGSFLTTSRYGYKFTTTKSTGST